MSGNKAPEPKKKRGPGRPKNAERNLDKKVTPKVTMFDTVEEGERFIVAANARDRLQESQLLGAAGPADIGRLERVYPIRNQDGSVRALDTRWTGTVEDHLKAEKAKRKRPKVHKVVYRAEITGCDREKDNGLRLVVSSLLNDDPLIRAGLWCCLGAEEAAKAIDQYDRERTSSKNPLCPVLYWFEGYPAYVAGRDYIASVREAAIALGINPIAVGWAGGIKGAKAINLGLRPFDKEVVVKGVTDAFIAFLIVKHRIVVDNDKDGTTKAY